MFCIVDFVQIMYLPTAEPAMVLELLFGADRTSGKNLANKIHMIGVNFFWHHCVRGNFGIGGSNVQMLLLVLEHLDRIGNKLSIYQTI